MKRPTQNVTPGSPSCDEMFRTIPLVTYHPGGPVRVNPPDPPAPEPVVLRHDPSKGCARSWNERCPLSLAGRCSALDRVLTVDEMERQSPSDCPLRHGGVVVVASAESEE